MKLSLLTLRACLSIMMVNGLLVSCAVTEPATTATAVVVKPNQSSNLSRAQKLEAFLPSRIGNPGAFDGVTIEDLRRLNLVSTNLVSVLLQIPELRPMSVTLQVARPNTAFGNVLVRVLEDAGFALQLVSSDLGANYVSYGRRFSETDTGPVTDFNLSVNDIQLTREFVDKPNGIFPASLMSIRGTSNIEEIQVADSIFKEQGGEADTDSFVSGARSEDATSAAVSEVSVNPYDRVPVENQTARSAVIAQARKNYFDSDSLDRQLSDFDRYRRTVLIFEDKESLFLGEANKQSTRLLVREFGEGDLFMIKACNDVDGTNEVARSRAIRVEEEFIGYGVPQTSIYLAPCARTNYRHPADNSPVPVEVVHYRPKAS